MNERPACLELVSRNPKVEQLHMFKEKKENNLITVIILGYINTSYIVQHLNAFPISNISNWHAIYLNECNFYCFAGVLQENNRVFDLDIEEQKKDYDMFVTHCMESQSEFLKKLNFVDYKDELNCCESPF